MELLDYDRQDAELYNRSRPHPPVDLIPELMGLIRRKRVEKVVDLGSGTGLSTIVWKDHSDTVIGVEPNALFLQTARRENAAANVRYIHAQADETGLDESSADIVTAVNSIHWMNLETGSREICRILKPGGLFVSVGAVWLTIHDFKANARYKEIMSLGTRLLKERELLKTPTIQSEEQLEEFFGNRDRFTERMEFFLLEKELLHSETILGRLKTLGFIECCLQNEISEMKEALTAFADFMNRHFSSDSVPYSTSYEIRIGRV